MNPREIRVNVYNSSKFGHTNISFYENGQHVYTIGANIRMNVPQLAIPRLVPFEPDDGIYQDETAYHAQAVQAGTVISAGVPVTDLEYENLLTEARELEGQTFNYSLFTEACIDLVEHFYEETGHPGVFGDLFPEAARTGSLVWQRVSTTDSSPLSIWPDDVPYYTPPPLILPDPPPFPEPRIFGDLPPPPAFSDFARVPDQDPVDGHDPPLAPAEIASARNASGQRGDVSATAPASELAFEPELDLVEAASISGETLTFGRIDSDDADHTQAPGSADLHAQTPPSAVSGAATSPIEEAKLDLEGFSTSDVDGGEQSPAAPGIAERDVSHDDHASNEVEEVATSTVNAEKIAAIPVPTEVRAPEESDGRPPDSDSGGSGVLFEPVNEDVLDVAKASSEDPVVSSATQPTNELDFVHSQIPDASLVLEPAPPSVAAEQPERNPEAAEGVQNNSLSTDEEPVDASAVADPPVIPSPDTSANAAPAFADALEPLPAPTQAEARPTDNRADKVPAESSTAEKTTSSTEVAAKREPRELSKAHESAAEPEPEHASLASFWGIDLFAMLAGRTFSDDGDHWSAREDNDKQRETSSSSPYGGSERSGTSAGGYADEFDFAASSSTELSFGREYDDGSSFDRVSSTDLSFGDQYSGGSYDVGYDMGTTASDYSEYDYY